MALQAYAEATNNALTVYKAPELTPEEQEKRQKEAEELEKKLKFINEKVPHRVMNIMGSNAGAGSGTFHEYRLAKRREQHRLEQLDALWEEQQKQEEFEQKQQELKEQDEQRTAKRRAKRQKRKAKKKATGPDGVAGSGQQNDCGQESDSGDELQPTAADLD